MGVDSHNIDINNYTDQNTYDGNYQEKNINHLLFELYKLMLS